MNKQIMCRYLVTCQLCSRHKVKSAICSNGSYQVIFILQYKSKNITYQKAIVLMKRYNLVLAFGFGRIILEPTLFFSHNSTSRRIQYSL